MSAEQHRTVHHRGWSQDVLLPRIEGMAEWTRLFARYLPICTGQIQEVSGLLPNSLRSMSKPAGGNHSSPLSVTFHIARPQKYHFNYWGLWKSPMDLNSSKNLKSAFPGFPNFSAKFLGDSLGIGYIKSANSQWTFSTCKSCYFLLFHALSNCFSLFTR